MSGISKPTTCAITVVIVVVVVVVESANRISFASNEQCVDCDIK